MNFMVKSSKPLLLNPRVLQDKVSCWFLDICSILGTLLGAYLCSVPSKCHSHCAHGEVGSEQTVLSRPPLSSVASELF